MSLILETLSSLREANVLLILYSLLSSVLLLNSTSVSKANSLIFGDVSEAEVTMNGALEVTGNISGSATSTGSFGEINSAGRIFEQGTSVIDHATAMAIVFGG